jgi:hypothetical protein
MAKIIPRIPQYLLSLAGEYRVCSELNKRGIFATMTYGNRKSVDVYAINDRQSHTLKIEVKTSQTDRFVTRITQKGLNKRPRAVDFWVLFQIQRDRNGTFKERFLVLSHKEICKVQKMRNRAAEKKGWNLSKGVDYVTVKDVEPYEDKWSRIVEGLGRPAKS